MLELHNEANLLNSAGDVDNVIAEYSEIKIRYTLSFMKYPFLFSADIWIIVHVSSVLVKALFPIKPNVIVCFLWQWHLDPAGDPYVLVHISYGRTT